MYGLVTQRHHKSYERGTFCHTHFLIKTGIKEVPSRHKSK